MPDIDEIPIPGGESHSVDCPMARTVTGHYLRQITITKRRQGPGMELTDRQRQRLAPFITLWKR